MNELQAIVEAYGEARERGERAALGTVVNVIGSAYRRPGARMLMTENGHTVGSISGGCLERDVAERAAQVMASRTTRIIEYDTRGNEDIVWGLGLGCNGVVEVLLESLHEGSDGARALQFIAECLPARRSGILATVIRAAKTTRQGRSLRYRAGEVGERLLLDEHGLCYEGSLADEELSAQICEDAREALACGRAMIRSYGADPDRMEIFFDVIMPPRALVIFGAERDAEPVVRLARMLGWHVSVVDTRARSATPERFSEADAVILCRAEDTAARISLAPNTAVVVMTHNYLDDIALLRALLPSPAGYIGILGPKSRTAKLLEEIRDETHVTDAQMARLHGPIGLDIGAKTPEEIALAIIAEIKAVCEARGGGYLRDRNTPIHDTAAANFATIEISVEPHTAPRQNASLLFCRSS